MIAKLHEANVPVTPNATSTYNVNHAYGTAEMATEYATQLSDIGVDDVNLMIQMGTIPQEACMETIRQWGEKIIPQFR